MPDLMSIPLYLDYNPTHGFKSFKCHITQYMSLQVFGIDLAASGPSLATMNCRGLAAQWEKCDELRERIRSEKRVMIYSHTDTYCKPNRVNAVQNAWVMEPILGRLGKHPKHALPHLEELQREVNILFEKCGLDKGNKAPYKTSVEIKKLAGFVKRRSLRKEVTKERGC